MHQHTENHSGHDHGHKHHHGHTHEHSHGHHHHHHATPKDGKNTAFIIGIILNGLYVVIQVVVGIANHSMALLADAGHNLGDVASLALSLLAFRLTKVKPTDQFTYGYRKTTILAALINSVVLLLSVGIIGFEAVRSFFHPHVIAGGTVAAVAVVGIIINMGSALLFFRDKEHDLNTKSAYMHLLTDALLSMGVVVSGIVIYFTGWNWLDSAVSIVLLLTILAGTWNLLTSSFKMSMDAVPANVDKVKIEETVLNTAGVDSLHHMHIWAMSTTENALTAHLVLSDTLTFDEKMKVVHEIKHELLHLNIHHATVELESTQLPCENEEC